MAERPRPAPRLDTPRRPAAPLVRRPAYDSDAFGVFAEQFARFMGTAKFLIYMTGFVVIWVRLEPRRARRTWRWDDYPFIFLTLMLSLQASYAAPLILLAQNRQEQRDKVIAEQDRQANARAHADMEFLAREVASLRMAVGEVATRDFLRSELRSLLQRPRRASPEAERAQDGSATRTRRRPGTIRRDTHHLDSGIMSTPSLEQVNAALATVNDPEIKRPITELGMVDSVEIDDGGRRARDGAADRRRLPAQGHHHPRRHRRGQPGRRRHRRRPRPSA